MAHSNSSKGPRNHLHHSRLSSFPPISPLGFRLSTDSDHLRSPSSMASDPPSKRRKKRNIDDTSTESSSPKSKSSASASPSPSPSPASPLVVFAHGAGAPSTSDWMIRWKGMIKEALGAVEVVTFDYPYMSGGKRKAPPKAEKLVDHHLDVVKDATKGYPGHPLVLVGKSMGSRVSCMVAKAEDIHVSAIICLGYPLKGTNGALRDETLLQLTVPTMFVQGSKDGLCPLDKLAATRQKMKCINELHVIDGGDHSFKIGKKYLESIGSNQDNAERRAVEAIAELVFLSTDDLSLKVS